jgi:D-3-phosphoglycerate dehydrogenase
LKIVIPYGNVITDEAIAAMRAVGAVVFTRDASHEALLAEAADADVIIAGPATLLDRQLIESAPRLQLIARIGVGVDTVDLEAATERGVFVTNNPALSADSVSEYTLALLLGLAKNIPRGDRAVREARWAPIRIALARVNVELCRKTHGVVGMGEIGSRVAAVCRALGMRVLYYKRNRNADLERLLGLEYAPFERLIRESDTISLHTPLTDETRNLFDSAQFAVMKHTAFLINQSRGEVVNEKALIQALKDGTIGGYATDVYDEEPPNPENELLKLDNVVLGPHVGASSREARLRASMAIAERVLAVAKGGIPSNVVNKQVLARAARR